MLKWITRHSTIVMPLLCVVGTIFPALSNTVLTWLPNILFFLMFFTLVGIDQKALVLRLAHASSWRFALLACGAMCALCVGIAKLLGAPSELLLAIGAVTATAPLFGSGAIVNALGFDALVAMGKTIAATLLMPVILLIVLATLGREHATIDFTLYAKRLLIYVAMPMLLSVIVRRLLPREVLQRIYPKVARYNIILLMAFPLGLMGEFRKTLDSNVSYAMALLGISVLLCLLFYFVAYGLYKKRGYEAGITAAVVCGGRNLLLTYTIAMPFLGSAFLPLVGALQIPMFSLPYLAKQMLKRHTDAFSHDA